MLVCFLVLSLSGFFTLTGFIHIVAIKSKACLTSNYILSPFLYFSNLQRLKRPQAAALNILPLCQMGKSKKMGTIYALNNVHSKVCLQLLGYSTTTTGLSTGASVSGPDGEPAGSDTEVWARRIIWNRS